MYALRERVPIPRRSGPPMTRGPPMTHGPLKTQCPAGPAWSGKPRPCRPITSNRSHRTSGGSHRTNRTIVPTGVADRTEPTVTTNQP